MYVISVCLRGGSFNNHASNVRCANRKRNVPTNRNTNVGLLIALCLISPK